MMLVLREGGGEKKGCCQGNVSVAVLEVLVLPKEYVSVAKGVCSCWQSSVIVVKRGMLVLQGGGVVLSRAVC